MIKRELFGVCRTILWSLMSLQVTAAASGQFSSNLDTGVCDSHSLCYISLVVCSECLQLTINLNFFF